MRCTRAVVELKEGENILFIKLPEYEKYGTVVSIDTISVSDGRLCEMRQPVYDNNCFFIKIPPIKFIYIIHQLAALY